MFATDAETGNAEWLFPTDPDSNPEEPEPSSLLEFA